jgi:Tfp pilus assembly major pilin PilA
MRTFARGLSIRGFTLIEAMVLLVIVSIIAVAAGVGLQAVAKVPTQTDAILAIDNEIVNRLEQMRAEPWATMSTKATSLTNASPGVSINSKFYSCTVAVVDADADGDGSTDADYRKITVTIGAQSMISYVTNP